MQKRDRRILARSRKCGVYRMGSPHVRRLALVLGRQLLFLAMALPASAEVPGTTAGAAGGTAAGTTAGGDREGKVGVGMNLIGPLGSFEGGLTVAGHLGWSPRPQVRFMLTGEYAVVPVGRVACDCAGPGPCCVGANASYAWLGIGAEAHATPGNRGDVYLSAELGAIGRNAWRPAAKATLGFELKLGRVTMGPNLGLICATRDSLFDDQGDVYFSLFYGARLVIAFDRGGRESPSGPVEAK